MKANDWQKVTEMAGGSAIEIERVRLLDQGIAIEGRFGLPPLARLSGEDQIFVAAFVRCHGSIKQMEKYFGVSYPTIKNRLNRLSAELPFVEVDPPGPADRPSAADLLSQLERGEMTVRDVLDELQPSARPAPNTSPTKDRS